MHNNSIIATVHSPESIFHIMKSRDQTSVLLSVFQPNVYRPSQEEENNNNTFSKLTNFVYLKKRLRLWAEAFVGLWAFFGACLRLGIKNYVPKYLQIHKSN